MKRSFVLLMAVVGLVACGNKKKTTAVEDKATEGESAEAVEKHTGGFSKDKIFLGMCSTFQGPQAGMGTEPYRGMMSYLLEVNATGGVNGRTFEVIPEDVGYDKERAGKCVTKMAAEQTPLAFVMGSGSPVVLGAATALEGLADKDTTLLGWIASPSLFKNSQTAKDILKLRNVDSAAKMLSSMMEAGAKKIGLLIEDNETGTVLSTQMRGALTAKDMKPVIEVMVPATARFDTDKFTDQVQAMKKAGVDAVIACATYQKAAGFTRDAREAGWNVPIGTTAVGDTAFRLLAGHEQKTGKRVSNAFIGVLFEPPIGDDKYSVVVEHKRLMEKRNPVLPDIIKDPNYRSLPVSGGSLEGFLAAKVLVEAVRRAGPDLSRAKLRTTIEGIKDWDVGGLRLTYGQGVELHEMWINGATATGTGSVTDMKKYLASEVDATGAPWPSLKAAPAAAASAAPAGSVAAKPAPKK